MNQEPGVFRRRIIVDVAEGQVTAAVEDDFHHYAITLRHDGSKVIAVQGEAKRTPYDTCSGAVDRLQELVGLPISTGIVRTDEGPDPRQQCTHWFELGLIAIAQAARGERLCYDVEIPDRPGQKPYDLTSGKLVPRPTEGRTSARLYRNGELMLEWELDGETIISSGPFAGQAIRGMVTWAAPRYDDDMLEAIKVLRRGLHVANGRVLPNGVSWNSSALSISSLGACYVFQPERIAKGTSNPQSRLDFSHDADKLLADQIGQSQCHKT